MTRIQISLLFLFGVAGLFVIAHVLYVNKFSLHTPSVTKTIDYIRAGVLSQDKGNGGVTSDSILITSEEEKLLIQKLAKESKGSNNQAAGASGDTSTHSTEKKLTEQREKIELPKADAKAVEQASSAKGATKVSLPKDNTNGQLNEGKKLVFNDADLDVCPKAGRGLVGLMFIDQSLPEMDEIEKQMSILHGGTVEKGGWWKPHDCKPRAKTAIIIPYRNREQQLKMFLRHLHPVLQRQLLEYRIVVVEQAGSTPFNRAGLFNVGFKEALKLGDYNCFVFSDVDLLPEDDRNNYGCPTSPRHMSVAVDKFNYQLPYATIFGGVGSFKKEDFVKVNGFSNKFWGWGGEDDDLYNRITARGFTLTRPSLKIGRYTMIKIHHFQSHGADPNRLNLLQNSQARMDRDGLSSLKYEVVEFKELPLLTIATVNIART